MGVHNTTNKTSHWRPAQPGGRGDTVLTRSNDQRAPCGVGLKIQNQIKFFGSYLTWNGRGDEYICVCICCAKSERFFICRENVCKTLADPCWCIRTIIVIRRYTHTEGWQQQGRWREERKEKKNAQVPSESPLRHNGPASSRRRESVEESASRGPGVHVCILYTEEEEELASLNLVSLTRARERRFCWPLHSRFLCLHPNDSSSSCYFSLRAVQHRSPTHWISILFF